MSSVQNLQRLLLQMDGHGYKAYKQLKGHYQFPDFVLVVDHVQGDPFAAPSRMRVQVPQQPSDESQGAQFPATCYANRSREVALRDYLTRQFAAAATQLREKRGSGNSGLIAIASTSQHVLERNSVLVSDRTVEARFVVGLPAKGRQVLGQEAIDLLCHDLPQIVARSLFWNAHDPEAIQQHLDVVEDADSMRQQLEPMGLLAFIPNGAILPRQSGVDDRPLKTNAIAFQSPDSLTVELQRPNQGAITGMGIPTGITLIVGGGYHGKSTVLKAIADGIYNHIPGDGREGIVTHPAAVKVRAEDGRSVAGVDISPFINHLPHGQPTTSFSTENASGSTSQAASISEALEAGAKLLLIDEDTSATNFMIRDRRMQALIAKDHEPITPFIDNVELLYRDRGVSTILVIGGSGDYFDVADRVIAMTHFQPHDVTQQAIAIAQQYGTARTPEGGDRFADLMPRIPIAKRLDSRSDSRTKLKVRDVDELVFGAEAIDLSAVEQLVEVGQVRAIGAAIALIQDHYLDEGLTLPQIVNQILTLIQSEGFDALTAAPQGDLVEFRGLELAAALNRLRSLVVGPTQ